jgi:hypothetical protein
VDDLGGVLLRVVPHREIRQLAGAQLGRRALGNAEAEEQGIAPDEGRQDGPDLDILACLHGPRLDDPVERRPDVGVVEVELGLVEGGQRLGHVRRGEPDLGPPGLDLLARDQAGRLGDDGLAPLQARLGVRLGSLGLFVSGLGHVDRELEPLGLDFDEDLIHRGQVPLGEEDAVHHARDAARHLDLFERVDRAHGVDGVNEGAGGDRSDLDRELDPGLGAGRTPLGRRT